MTTDDRACEAARRKCLVLSRDDAAANTLSEGHANIDAALDALYGTFSTDRDAGPGGSAPRVARWLGDIRQYFPYSVVQVMQKDALERLGLQQMLCEPEMLAAVEPDVHLAATLLSLNRVMPNKTHDTARMVIARVVEALKDKLGAPMRHAVASRLNRVTRGIHPRHQNIDWMRTIRAILKHYQADYRTVISETRIGLGRHGRSLRDIVLCVDQSGSMAPSVIYASVFAAVFASIKAVTTSVVVFQHHCGRSNALVVRSGRGIVRHAARRRHDHQSILAYCQGLVTCPNDTIFVLISDLHEGDNNVEMLKRAAILAESCLQKIALSAQDNSGAPIYDHVNAAKLATMGILSFACTPDKFPDLMAARSNATMSIMGGECGHRACMSAYRRSNRQGSIDSTDALKSKKPAQSILSGLLRITSLTITYFHTGCSTIIGAMSFHGPVRDGKGWYRLAMVIRLDLYGRRYRYG